MLDDDSFAIERKEKNDFLQTISKGWARFCREINRMNEAKFSAKVIIVECDYTELLFSKRNGEIIPPDHKHYMLSPQFVVMRVAELSMRGASVLFACDALKASYLAYSILLRRSEQLCQKSKR